MGTAVFQVFIGYILSTMTVLRVSCIFLLRVKIQNATFLNDLRHELQSVIFCRL